MKRHGDDQTGDQHIPEGVLVHPRADLVEQARIGGGAAAQGIAQGRAPDIIDGQGADGGGEGGGHASDPWPEQIARRHGDEDHARHHAGRQQGEDQHQDAQGQQIMSGDQGLQRCAVLAQRVQRQIAIPAHAEDQGGGGQQHGQGQKSFDPVQTALHPLSSASLADFQPSCASVERTEKRLWR